MEVAFFQKLVLSEAPEQLRETGSFALPSLFKDMLIGLMISPNAPE